MSATSSVEVRDVQGVEELRACQALQRRAWGIVEDGYVVPVATMAGVQRVGGLVLGAFLERRLVGFSFAFLGRLHGAYVLYSQLSGVEPELQGQGIGQRLKEKQRRRAAEMGLATVAWAFDPLQAGNAHFNLAVLGATSRTYEVDLYGSRTDELNAGLETDRLLVEWPTTGQPRGRREPWPDAVELVQATACSGGFPRPIGVGRLDVARPAQIEIPVSIRAVTTADRALAAAWQQAVREAFRTAFGAGYVTVGFARGERPRYLLERAP